MSLVQASVVEVFLAGFVTALGVVAVVMGSFRAWCEGTQHQNKHPVREEYPDTLLTDWQVELISFHMADRLACSEAALRDALKCAVQDYTTINSAGRTEGSKAGTQEENM